MDFHYRTLIWKTTQVLEFFRPRKFFQWCFENLQHTSGIQEIYLLSFMRSKQDEIKNVVQINTQNGAQKLQFSALVQLTKPTVDESVDTQPA